MEELKVCVDLNNDSNPNSLKFALFNSYKERDSNLFTDNYRAIIQSDTLTEQLLLDAKEHNDFDSLLFTKQNTSDLIIELAVERGKLWANGRELKIKFLGGNDTLRSRVIFFARQWEEFANIKFNFIESGDAEIRISFMMGMGSWSAVGTDALNNTDQSKPTMNFGWLDDNTPDSEFSRVVIHEFGHCLGCIHEHQSPEANITWNKEVVYNYYKSTQTPPWDKNKVDHNIFNKFTSATVSNSVFDPNSIMLYPIPKQFTTDGFSVGMNEVLSESDKNFIAKCYPR
ncbi:M12 family metallopeptidase [Flavobacterium sp. CF136]|uniref:M12 family metallopeptidase n=1 Tax=Flavobacterium sp. (strain CF136) TaxID=1144313 RepID=UPI0002715262|nr:M12 family metallopeptidase [Flavobacterium sp. CF136]EJL65244.1 Pregnancy-associated plasma protein-A [Flavobacterium sp. CF136]